MKKVNLILVVLLLFSSFAAAQKGKAILILKDSTHINGIGEISGFSSIVTVKFKNDTLKSKTFRSKEIIGIDILENNYYRKFRFKYIDGAKFPEILEVVSIDNLSLYVRIYEGRVLSNSHYNEPIAMVGQAPNQVIKLDNGQEIKVVQSRNLYMSADIPRYSYYVGIGQSDKVEHLYTKGLPFAEGFKKSLKKYFKNCPELLAKVENDEYSNDELLSVLEFYNRNCADIKSEGK